MKLRGVLTANLGLTNQYFLTIDFNVIKDCPYKMILGKDFLENLTEDIFHFENKQINLHNDHIQLCYKKL